MIRHLLGSFLLAGLFFTSAFAEVKIEGSLAAPEYKVLRLRATGDVKDAALLWDVSDEDVLDCEEVGDRLLLTGPPGTYKVKLRVVRMIAGKAIVETARVTIVLGVPRPQPRPDPPKPDPPRPTPAGGPLWVILVEETAEASATRGKLLGDVALAKRIKDKGHHWRVVDQDAKNRDGNPPADLKPWIERAKKAGLPRLFLVTEKGRIVDEGPAPKTAKELVDLLEKAGG